ncbi:NADH-quinone oxidoreductase subunit D [Bdellovibrionota bacterium]
MSVKVSSIAERTKIPETPTSAVDTQEYFINMGPQHPSCHGVLRLIMKLDGETIREVIPVLGYIHRGIEKIGENFTYRKFIHLVDRLDYISALANNWVVSMGVEKAANIEIPDRVQYIRTIVAELQRIQSHQLWWGVMGMDLGAFTPFLYGMRDREQICDILEETIGGRLLMNYIQPGGVMFDIHPNFVKRTKEFLKYFRPKLDEYETLLSGNPIFQERCRNVGIMSPEKAVSFGTTGPVLRGSGVPYDLRKVDAYGVYDKVEFDVPIGTVGDTWDRYYVRVEEMRQSMKIIEQLIDNIPEGKHMVLKPAAKLRLPEGQYYSQLETARGIIGVFIVSTGEEFPYRIHVRTPGFNNLWCVTDLAPGWRIGDMVAILSSLDLVIPDIDR